MLKLEDVRRIYNNPATIVPSLAKPKPKISAYAKAKEIRKEVLLEKILNVCSKEYLSIGNIAQVLGRHHSYIHKLVSVLLERALVTVQYLPNDVGTKVKSIKAI